MVDIASISLRVDTSDLKRGQVELKNLERTGAGVERNVNRATDGMSGGFASLRKTIGLVGTALAAIGSAQLIREAIQYSDAWKQVNNQLRQVTGSESELRGVRQTLLDISRQTNTELDSTVSLYSTLTRSTKEMGISSQEVADVTKTVNNLFMASGASAQEAANAIRQLSQGLAAGALRGDEFNAVAENAPRIMDAIAEKLQMTRGELREFAAQGGITSEILVEALQDYREEAQRMADQTDRTFGQHMVNANTNMTEFVGGLNGVNGAVSELGKEIEDFTKLLADNSAQINEFLNDIIVFAKSAKLIISEITAQGQGDPWYMKPVTMGPAGMLYRYLGFGGEEEFEKSRDDIVSGIKRIRQEAEDRKIEEQMLRNGDAVIAWMRSQDELTDSVDKTEQATEQFVFTAKELRDTIGGEVIKEVEAMAQEFSKLRDTLYPQQAAVRELMREYSLLLQFAPEMRDAWLDANVKITTSTRKAADQVENLREHADPLAESWQAALERIDSAFVDLWKSAFDGFKDFADALKNAFFQLLAEMAHRATTQKILISLGLAGGSGTALAGAPAAGGAGGFSLSSLTSLSTYTKLLQSNPLAGLGDWITKVGGDSPFLTEVGARVGDMSALDIGLSAIAGYAGKYLGGKVGEAIFGKEAESSWGAAIGGAAGSLFGPIGALLGGALGSAADVLFGGDGKKRAALGVVAGTGDFGGTTATGASGLQLSTYVKRAGDEGQQVADALLASFLALDAGLTSVAATLGTIVDLSGENLTGKAHQAGKTGGSFFGSAEFNKLVAEDVMGAADAFVSAWVDRVNELTGAGIDLAPLVAIQREGELLSDVLLRASANLAPMNATLEAMGLAAYDVSIAGMAMADQLAQAMGGMENFAAATARYYDLFYTEEEKLAAITAQVADVFAALNMSMPATTAEFRGLVDGLDLTTDAGRAAFSQLLAVAPAFHQVATAADEAAQAASALAAAQEEQARAAAAAALAARNNTLTDIAGTILDQYQTREATLASLQERLLDLDGSIADVRDSIAEASSPVASVVREITTSVDGLVFSSSQLRSLADNLLGTAASLRLGNLSPLNQQGRLEEARRQYDAAQSAARDGDASGLASAAQAYLQQAAAYYASSPAYVAIFDDVTGNLEAMGASLNQQADAAERQERAQAAQQAALDAINATAAGGNDLTKLYGDLDKLLQERQLVEQQIANLTATDSLGVMTSQLDRLVAITDGIGSMTDLLANLPASLADQIAAALGVAITEYRALTPTEQFFAPPAFASGGSYGGGLALVGEQGPELINFNRGGYVHNAADTRAMLGGDPRLVPLVETLINRVERVEGQLQQQRKEATTYHKEDRQDMTENNRALERQNTQLARMGGGIKVIG